MRGDDELSDPFLLQDMDKAVERIGRAVEEGQKICIYGDYDCDGITSTVLLFYTYLQSIGADVFFYIPDRDREGYGMNAGAVQAVAAKGTSLIVTVDNGISALDEISYAVRLGMDGGYRPPSTQGNASVVFCSGESASKGSASWISRFGGCWSCV